MQTTTLFPAKRPGTAWLAACLAVLAPLAWVAPSHGQPNFARTNIAYRYESAPMVRLAHQVVPTPTTVHIHFQFSGESPLANYQFAFVVASSRLAPIPDTQTAINTDSALVGQAQGTYHFGFALARDYSGQYPVCLLHVFDNARQQRYVYDIDLPESEPTGPPKPVLYAQGRPLRGPFVAANLPVAARLHGHDPALPLYAFYYDHDFLPALPPMVTQPRKLSKGLRITEVVPMAQGEPTRFAKQGLYFIQQDSASLVGTSLRVARQSYPKPATLAELVDPLVYLTTNNEKNKLQKAKADKEAFDRFWLTLTRSKDRARGIIKRYYQRVREANQHFTTYKQGWKTDQGMVYTVFGPPAEVYRNDVGEVWHYTANADFPKIKFVFRRINNIFTPNHYVLSRTEKHRDAWFKAVDLWRKGRM